MSFGDFPQQRTDTFVLTLRANARRDTRALKHVILERNIKLRSRTTACVHHSSTGEP